jgi:hypothetical protein
MDLRIKDWVIWGEKSAEVCQIHQVKLQALIESYKSETPTNYSEMESLLSLVKTSISSALGTTEELVATTQYKGKRRKLLHASAALTANGLAKIRKSLKQKVRRYFERFHLEVMGIDPPKSRKKPSQRSQLLHSRSAAAGKCPY